MKSPNRRAETDAGLSEEDVWRVGGHPEDPHEKSQAAQFEEL